MDIIINNSKSKLMNTGSNSLKKFRIKNSIKAKLISLFILIILVMSIISITTYFTTKNSIRKLNDIIDTTMQANLIISEVKELSTNTNTNNGSLYEQYSNLKTKGKDKAEVDKQRKAIDEAMQKISNSLTLLKTHYIKDKNGLSTLSFTLNSFSYFQNKTEKMFLAYDKSDWTTAFSLKDTVIQGGGFLVSSLQDVLSSELSYSQQQKTIINKQAAQTGMIIILAIIILGTLSIGIGYFIIGRITGTISSLAEVSQEIARGNLQVEIINTKSHDEVSILTRSFNTMVENLRTLIKNISDRENQKRKMEIQVLRAQVSPHFLYNTLNTVSYLALMHNAENIHKITTSLVDLLHAAINLDDTLISVDDELRYVQSYLNIQQYRYVQNITIEQQIDEDVHQYKVARMVLQPIVENSIIHGLSEMQHPGHIRIRVWEENKELVFSITDNGMGMSQQRISQVMTWEHKSNQISFSGIGLRNVDERIKLQFGQEYGIHI